MKSKSVLIVGCGELGERVVGWLQPVGWEVAGLRRDPSRLSPGVSGHAADYTVTGELDFIEALAPDYVLAIFNPAGRTESGYRAGFTGAMQNLLNGLGAHRPKHIIACSSTRVFAERQGGWVNEHSALALDDPLAEAIIDMERLLLSSACNASIVRFAGIYGGSGGRLVSRVARGELCSPQPLRYSNRIHREDCAGFLAHLLLLADAGTGLSPVYLGVDDEPAPQYEVERWLAREMGVAEQPSSAPPMEHAGGHKRCRNDLLRETGYELRYPDYRRGYRTVLAK